MFFLFNWYQIDFTIYKNSSHWGIDKDLRRLTIDIGYLRIKIYKEE